MLTLFVRRSPKPTPVTSSPQISITGTLTVTVNGQIYSVPVSGSV